MNQRPLHIWLVIALLAAATVWLLYAVATAAVYFIQGGHSLRHMTSYLPVLLGACVCAIACVGLLLRKAWVRWLFLLPVAVTGFQLLALAPYILESLKPIDDPAAKASIGYVLSGAIQPLVLVAFTSALAAAVFRYFRRERPAHQPRSRANGLP